MGLLVLVRHGQTNYNLEQRFCGLTDVPLAEKGILTTKEVASQLENFHLTDVFSSNLIRAQETAQIILDYLGQSELKIIATPNLNERDYGKITGKKHRDMEKVYSKEQVRLWRRSYNIAPPGGESLEDVYRRVINYFETKIRPILKDKKSQVLISAHGNSLRALIKYLDKIADSQITKLEIVYDHPYLYSFAGQKIQRLDNIPRVFSEISQ